jgi:hypothetical protein
METIHQELQKINTQLALAYQEYKKDPSKLQEFKMLLCILFARASDAIDCFIMERQEQC